MWGTFILEGQADARPPTLLAQTRMIPAFGIRFEFTLGATAAAFVADGRQRPREAALERGR
ncbi:MAG: hypothetical protein JNK68_03680 [Betaproteobacteria bacterium]|nr:hypothetical protein [Betaproteobacteria bacterium]